ncbi:MAG: hypothetical protein FJW35_14435 [Acidobacteria bacterium]|nr:hypothetical protein [Acidobacteriota bacterium]
MTSCADKGSGFQPGRRVLLDAHNCYPYGDLYADRISRALDTGPPLAIEIDLAWHADEAGGSPRIIITHGEPYTGKEPGLQQYFFERVRPIVEKALKDGDEGDWPLLVLNINDMRTEERAFFEAVWDLTGQYEDWLCTAVKGSTEEVAQIEAKPILILTGGGKMQLEFFYDRVPVGGKLRMFGTAKNPQSGPHPGLTPAERAARAVAASPEALLPEPATNFRRWWNNSWNVVELGGASMAGDWTAADEARLRSLVEHGHNMGYWIRFYTLDGFTSNTGDWGTSYNFGSLEAAQLRWEAAIAAGVDFIATDQVEELSPLLKGGR